MTERSRDLPRMTADEYLAFEEASDVKHEYVDGYVYPMGGATERHERIVANVLGHLWMASRGGPCAAFGSNLKVSTPDGRFYYPDGLVVCSTRDEDVAFVVDPCVIVELTSPSTRRTDQYEKRDSYARISSLRAYLVVEQGQRQVDRWWRDADGGWQHEVLVEMGTVEVPCPTMTLSLDEIYEGVTFPTPRPQRVREPEPAG
jgi:Uma2 family endonuclease